MARTVAALALVAGASALVAPVSKVSKVVEKYTDSTLKSSPGGFMEQGTEMFQEQFPEFNRTAGASPSRPSGGTAATPCSAGPSSSRRATARRTG